MQSPLCSRDLNGPVRAPDRPGDPARRQGGEQRRVEGLDETSAPSRRPIVGSPAGSRPRTCGTGRASGPTPTARIRSIRVTPAPSAVIARGVRPCRCIDLTAERLLDALPGDVDAASGGPRWPLRRAMTCPFGQPMRRAGVDAAPGACTARARIGARGGAVARQLRRCRRSRGMSRFALARRNISPQDSASSRGPSVVETARAAAGSEDACEWRH